jgi:thioredoxin 1
MSTPPSTTPSQELPTLSSKTAYLSAVNYEGITVLEATAAWCTQCRAVAPEILKLSQEFPDVKFYTYDVEESPDIAQELGVSQMPTFSVFKDGDIRDGVRGARVGELRRVLGEEGAGK